MGSPVLEPRGDGLDFPNMVLYIVHMKRVTASEARKNWFRLLDEVASGEVVVIERRGRRVVLHREEKAEGRQAKMAKDYGKLLQVPEEEGADAWSWDWSGAEGDLILKTETRR
jgi:antitoxin (DNA-binding transcriptional repressor) of toxin-antitoxin stability system